MSDIEPHRAGDATKKRKLSEASRTSVTKVSDAKKSKVDDTAKTSDASGGGAAPTPDPAKAPAAAADGQVVFLLWADALLGIMDGEPEDVPVVRLVSEVVKAYAAAQKDTDDEEAIWTHAKAVRQWHVEDCGDADDDVSGDEYGERSKGGSDTSPQQAQSAEKDAGTLAAGDRPSLASGVKGISQAYQWASAEASRCSKDSWWWELIAQREKPAADKAALRMELEGVSVEPAQTKQAPGTEGEHNGTWWVTDVVLAGSEAEAAISEMVDILSRYSD